MQNSFNDWRDRRDREWAAVPVMDRAEYLRKYPKGGPERFSGLADSEEYREFIAAIKRRDIEARRPGWHKFWWAVAFLGVVFGAAALTVGLSEAVFTIFVLVMVYCFIEMGMNLPNR